MQTLNGIDCISKYNHLFKGKKLGLITSVSGVDRDFTSTIDILNSKYQLTTLYAPEHGVRGDKGAGDTVADYIDEVTGIPVYSLYRKDSKHLSAELVKDIDALVFDIQDIGSRYYTFISTMIYALEDCKKFQKEFIVLDRINMLGGDEVSGTLLNLEYKSFVGAYDIPNRYGLTIGELAQMVNKERNINCDLTIIPVENWQRTQSILETDLPFVMPSLGIPTFETAFMYVGTCLFEGTNISEGRGTTTPFLTIGAPFINAKDLIEKMKKKNLLGIAYTPIYFTPTFSKFKDENCQGIHLHVTDYKTCDPFIVGVELLFAIKEMYSKEFHYLKPYSENGKMFIEYLTGSDNLTSKEMSKENFIAQAKRDAEIFKKRKSIYEMY